MKICKKHGLLDEKDISLRKGRKGIRDVPICRLCNNEKSANARQKEGAKEKANAYSLQYKNNNREKVNEWIRKDRAKKPEKYQGYERRWTEKNRARRNITEICRKRNIEISEYEELVKKQNNLCAICNKPETRKSRRSGNITRLGIDHDHVTNLNRGLLCHDCNTGIGKFKDDIELLNSAINYLKEFEAKHDEPEP